MARLVAEREEAERRRWEMEEEAQRLREEEERQRSVTFRAKSQECILDHLPSSLRFILVKGFSLKRNSISWNKSVFGRRLKRR